MGYSKSYAWKYYLGILTILVASQYVTNVVGLRNLPPLANAMQMWMLYQTVRYCCGFVKAVEMAPLITAAPSTNNSAPRERLYYLDNLKVFLTCMVIIHHICCMFAGGGWVWNFNGYVANGYSNTTKQVASWILTLNQAYFMCMFFFISGYFTPSSFHKKGKHAFLKDKFKRLGIPFLAVSWVLFPLLILSSIFMINDLGSVSGKNNNNSITDIWWYALIPNPGPLWFVGWLCIFNTIYASVDHSKSTVMACPHPLRLLLWSTPLNVLNFALMLTGLGSFIYMPIAQGSLPFDILCFYGGCVARNNRWLENGTPGGLIEIMERRGIRPAIYGLFLVMAIGMLFFALADPEPLVGLVGMFGACTIEIALIFFIQLDFFRNYFNFTGKISSMLASSAYTAYIIHPIFINVSSYLFLKTYKSETGDDSIVWIAHNLTSTSEFTADHAQTWLMGGMFVASIFAAVTTFFFAFWVRKLPGFRAIL